MQSLFFLLTSLCGKPHLNSTLGVNIIKTTSPNARKPKTWKGHAESSSAKGNVRWSLIQPGLQETYMVHFTSALRGRLQSWPSTSEQRPLTDASAAWMMGVLHSMKLSITNKDLYLSPVWLVLTATTGIPWSEQVQVLLHLLGTDEVFTGQRGPAFYRCVIWIFSTIT